MAKYSGTMGKVTYVNGNGETIEFVPSQVDISTNAPDRYFSRNSDTICGVPDNLINISIEGTYHRNILTSTYEYTVGKVDTFGYAPRVGDCNNMKLSMNWLKTNQVYDKEFGQGMLFLYENRAGFFASEAGVIDNMAVMIVSGQLPRDIDLDDYAGGLWVTGFDVPKPSHPLINALLKPVIHHRGTVAQNNPRTIYEYMSDETYGLGLYVGLTVHDILGSWSSWPVHEYEINALTAPMPIYPDFSEKFAFITEPMGSWGLQARAQANGNKSVLMFKDADIIDIPLGAHPNVAAPATRLAYFWAYMGAPRKDF